jgi:hypothetical protein
MKNLLKYIVIGAFMALALSNAAVAVEVARYELADRGSGKPTAQTHSAKPAPAPQRWRGLIGEYGPDNGILYILEKDQSLCTLFKGSNIECLKEVSRNVFKFLSQSGPRAAQTIVFSRDAQGRATLARIEKAESKKRSSSVDHRQSGVHQPWKSHGEQHLRLIWLQTSFFVERPRGSGAAR